MRTGLVIGGGARVWQEVAEAQTLFTPDLILAINDMATIWAGRLDHWVTLHPEHLPRWFKARAELGFAACNVWTPHAAEQLPPGYRATIEPDYDPSGLSGLYAVKVLRRCDVDRIVLAGVPMDRSGHVLGRRGHWITLTRRDAWTLQKDEIKHCVRAMSGWTREEFGYPAPEWFAESCLRRAG
jgi:hypothetical protein